MVCTSRSSPSTCFSVPRSIPLSTHNRIYTTTQIPTLTDSYETELQEAVIEVVEAAREILVMVRQEHLPQNRVYARVSANEFVHDCIVFLTVNMFACADSNLCVL